MNINQRNAQRILDVTLFCRLYELNRDFILQRNLIKHDCTNYKDAEKMADFCNTIIKTRTAKPTDFIQTEDEKNNAVIDAHQNLKKGLNDLKQMFGCKKRDEIYKAVKLFYRKKYFCYEMDCYFIMLIRGYIVLVNGFISYDQFMNVFFVEYSLFDGSKKQLKLKRVVQIFQKINEVISQCTKY